MTAKEILEQYPRLNAEIASKQQRLDEYRALAEKTTQALSSLPGAASRKERPREDLMLKIADLSAEINRDIDRLVDLQFEIDALLLQLPDETERRMLRLRYLEGKTYREIALTTGYAQRYSMQKVSDALRRLDKIKSA